MMYNTLSEFYTSAAWKDFCAVLKAERLNSNGELICEHCHKPIVKKYDCIGHHKDTMLTLDNVNDCNVSMNPNNVSFVHFKCHNALHDRFCAWTRHIYLIHGSPLAGKKTFVSQVAEPHDLIVDMDRIYACISNNPLYAKSGRIADNVFGVRDCLLDMIKTKRGRWVSAYIINTMPYKSERERFCIEYGAEPIHIDISQQDALNRLASASDGRSITDYTRYIEQYFTRYQE